MSQRVIKVLLVDDDPGDRKLTQQALAVSSAMESCCVDHAETLQGCLDRIRSSRYDIVLLDLNLPDSEGLTTVSRVLAACPEVPIVVLTGLNDEQVGLRAIHLGAQDYVTKGPGTQYVLRSAVRYAIERKAIEYRQQKILDSILAGVAILDAETLAIVDMNPAGCRLIGLPKDQIIGRSSDRFFGTQRPLKATADHKEPFFTAERELIVASGRRMPVIQTVGLFQSQDRTYRVTSFISLLEQKLYERSLEQLNQELMTVLKQVEHSKHQMEEFAHIAAHDLKNPVRAIGTLTDWILSDHAHNVDTEGREYLGQLKKKSQYLSDLSDSIIRYFEIKADYKKETVDCRAMVSELLGEMTLPTSVKVVIQGGLPAVSFVPAHLRLLFHCLMDNAVRFCRKDDGLVTIEATDKPDAWVFSITDNGPGIPNRYHDKIFRIFQKLEIQSERMGMGLALARKIVETHGGEIWVRSDQGQGCTFSFSICKSPVSATPVKA